MNNTTTSSSLSAASATIKTTSTIDDDHKDNSTIITQPTPPPSARLARTKTIHPLSCSVRRNRFANGSTSLSFSSFRSRSLDSDTDRITRHRRSLSKSKTLNYISTSSKFMRNIENGYGQCYNGRRDRRRRLFDTNVDQSPLWTTLTHARTLSDFTLES